MWTKFPVAFQREMRDLLSQSVACIEYNSLCEGVMWYYLGKIGVVVLRFRDVLHADLNDSECSLCRPPPERGTQMHARVYAVSSLSREPS